MKRRIARCVLPCFILALPLTGVAAESAIKTPAATNGFTASNGFAALASMDSNGNGVVDAQDANFAQLQVWRDLNQNGVSDAGELFTLQQLGIQSLNTAITSTPNATLAGGVQAQTGSFTRSDGTISTMADINFTQDTFHSR